MKKATIFNSANPTSRFTVKYCDTFFSRLRGLMFSKRLETYQGIILVNERENRHDSSIHMMFVNQDLAVFWLDQHMVVVDKVFAKKWSPFYIPAKPAQYILELNSSVYTDFSIGDQCSIVIDYS